MDDQASPQQSIRKLSHEQKVGFVLLLVFAVSALGLGVLQLRNTMYSPFQLGSGVPAEVSNEVNGVETLAYRDTDNDGLSDFEELYVYGTSPYLADTDSDGIADKQEIVQNENPLCPHGKYCSTQVASAYATASASGTFSYAQLSGGFASDHDFTADARNAQMNFLNQLKDDPTAVRNLLQRQGTSADDLNSLSDADIKAMVAKAIEESNRDFAAYSSSSPSILGSLTALALSGKMTSSSVSAAIAPTVTTPPATAPNTTVGNVSLPADLLKQLSDPTTARVLLIKQGMDKASVDQMTDAQIMTTVQEILNALAQSTAAQ
jgi:hypothetical protein